MAETPGGQPPAIPKLDDQNTSDAMHGAVLPDAPDLSPDALSKLSPADVVDGFRQVYPDDSEVEVPDSMGTTHLRVNDALVYTQRGLDGSVVKTPHVQLTDDRTGESSWMSIGDFLATQQAPTEGSVDPGAEEVHDLFDAGRDLPDDSAVPSHTGSFGGSLRSADDTDSRSVLAGQVPSVEYRAKIDAADWPTGDPSKIDEQGGLTDLDHKPTAEAVQGIEGESVPAEVVEEVGETAVEEQAEISEVDTSAAVNHQEAGEQTVGGDVQAESSAANQEEEFQIPELSEVFASPHSLEKALNDPDIDQNFKRELQSVYTAWQEVKLAGLTNTIWQEQIAPKLAALDQEAPQFRQQAQQALEHAGLMVQGLQRLADVVYSGGNSEDVLDVVRHYQFRDLKDSLLHDLALIADGDAVAARTHALDVEHWEADDRISRVRRGVEYGYGGLDSNDAEDMIGDMQDAVQAGATLAQITEDLQHELKSKGSINWRQKSADIETMVLFGRMSQEDMTSRVYNLTAVLEELFSTIGNGRRDTDQIEYGARVVAELIEPLEDMERMASLVHMASQQAQQ